MPPLYVVEQGAKIQKESRRLVVTKEDEVLQSVPLIKVEQAFIFGNVSITTPALVYLMNQGVDVVFCDQYGHYRGRVVGEASGHSELRRWQYRRVDDGWNRREALRGIKSDKRRKRCSPPMDAQ